MGTILQSAVVAGGSNRRPQRIGTTLAWVGKITGSASYATGGDTLPAKLLGMNAIEHGMVGPNILSGNMIEVLAQPDGSVKLRWVNIGAGTELANATDTSARTNFAMFFGH